MRYVAALSIVIGIMALPIGAVVGLSLSHDERNLENAYLIMGIGLSAITLGTGIFLGCCSGGGHKHD